MRTETVEAELRRLAPTTHPDALAATRARVMATVHGSAGAAEVPTRTGDDSVVPLTKVSQRRRLSRRIGAVAAVAAVGIVGATLWPDSEAHWIPAAYASWSAVPEPVTPGDAEAQAEECRTQMRSGDPDGTVADSLRLDDLVPVVAERRGDWTYTLLTVEDGGPHADVTCLGNLNTESPAPTNAGGGAGGIPPTPGPDQIQWFGAGWNGQWSDVWGYVGDDVARVTVTLSNSVVVDATVTNGYFAAWWPSVPWKGDDGQAPYTLTWYLEGGAWGGTYDWTTDSTVPQPG